MRRSTNDPLAIQAWRLKSIGASKGSQVCTLTWPGTSASVSVYKPKEKQALSFRYELDLPEQGKQHISFSIDIRWVYGNGFESLLLSCPNADCNKMVDTLYQALGGYFVCVVCWNLQEEAAVLHP